MQGVFVGRQPIFDRAGAIAGYELLFRDGRSRRADVLDDDEATRRVLANALTEFGLESLVGGADVYLNVTARFLADGWHRLLPPERTVLEILEHEHVDDDLLALVDETRRLGYRVAADDVRLDERDLRLARHVDVVKLDLPALGVPLDDVRSHLPAGVTLLAEKVETHEQHGTAHSAGMDLFQGFFFTRPTILERRGVETSRLAMLRLLAELEDASSDLGRLSAVIESDPALTYKLLRATNAGIYALPRHIDSVTDCVVLLGTSTVQRLAALLAMSAVDDKPAELAVRALVRARLCQLAANVARVDGARSAFTVGLLSLVDALVDRPIEAAVEGLPLSPAVADALVARQGELGAVLDAVVRWEREDPSGLLRYLPPDEASTVVGDALRWATSVVASEAGGSLS